MENHQPKPDQTGNEREQRLGQMKAEAEAAVDRGRLVEEAKARQRTRAAGPTGRVLRRLWRRLIVILVLIAIVAVLLAIFMPRIENALRVDVKLPGSLAELLPDAEMGYNQVDFQEAILGQTREKSELVVLEQDVQVTTEISQAMANVALFEKTQTLISYGTGVYAVDLSGIGAAQIGLDETARIITLTIPHATLTYVNFDVSKTESGETKRALFGFGDIKLTTEQMKLVEVSIETAMREKLDSAEALTAADERALVLVRELIEPLVKSVDETFSLKVIMA